MIKLSFDNKVGPVKYILTNDKALQPISEVDLSNDNTPIIATALQSVNELGRKLLKAAGDGDAHEVKSLLRLGSPFTSDWLGTSPIHLAAQNNNADVCEVLIKGGISKDARNKVDRTPLHLAAYEGHYQACEILLKHDAEINCKDMLNMTPLHWAVQNGHTSVVELLVKNGAMNSLKNRFDLSPQDIAVQINNMEILDILQTVDRQVATQNLLMQLQTEDMDREDMNLAENSNNEINCSVAPTIINLDNESCSNGMDAEDSLERPIVIDLESNTARNIETLSKVKEKQYTQNAFTRPLANYKIINDIMHSEENANSFSAAQLLRDHGITMLQNDAEETHILNTVMESGHSVVLTDVGKEVLNSVKQQEEKTSGISLKPKKIITVTPEQFLSMTNGQLVNTVNVQGKFKVVPVKPNVKRVIMKKNKPTPFANMIKVQTTFNPAPQTMESVKAELVQARKIIEEYKIKLKKKEVEVERYKMQLKLLLNSSVD